jgi:hypothetical protein
VLKPMPKDFGLLAKVIPLSTPAIVLLIFTKTATAASYRRFGN